MSSSTTALQLLDLIQSHRITSVIYVAAKLGIADLLFAGPKSVSELANATGANQAALARLCYHWPVHEERRRQLPPDRHGGRSERYRQYVVQGLGNLRRRNAGKVVERHAGNHHDGKYGRATSWL